LSAECRLTLTVRPARDAEEIAAAQQLRFRVFCEEQGVDRAHELDSLDRDSLHVVALDESGVVATCRLRFLERTCKLERMAVERRLRGLGAGAKLLGTAEELARERGAGTMVLNAQTRAREFYAANGYRPEGSPFMEAGIEHVRMTKPLALEAPT
jgi:predicted GNAT family N-acyltransferase